MSKKCAFLAHFGDISYNVFNMRISLLLKLQTYFTMHFRRQYLTSGKPLDLNNTLINSQYLEKFVCQVLVLQSIATEI